MKKIPTLFVRDPEDRQHVLPEVTPGCEWVLAGEGEATRKWDGTCTMLDVSGEWWARREVKPGKAHPPRFVPASMDDLTRKTVGWEPMAQSPFAKFHAEAIVNTVVYGPGTYELIGPKINGSPDGYPLHILIPHGWAPFRERADLAAAPRDFEGLRSWLMARDIEGIVFHHPSGHMVKIKRKDFS